MSEPEAKREIARAKEDLREAKAKLKELSDKLVELSEVMDKIEAAHIRLQRLEEKLFLEGFGKKSSFDRIDNH